MGREALLEAMPPFLGGGEMIEQVGFPTTVQRLPLNLRPAPQYRGAIGMAAAIDYLATIDREAAAAHEAVAGPHPGTGGRGGGPAAHRQPAHAAGIFSFLLEGTHPSDVGMLLDQQGIAVRTGHHCAQP